MNEHDISVIAAFSQSAGAGRLLRLTVSKVDGSRGASYCGAEKPRLDFEIAMQRAFLAVWRILGEPEFMPSGAECTCEALKNGDPVPVLQGGSLYGAFSMAFLRVFGGVGYRNGMRYQLGAVLDKGVQHADLSKIAVSAEGDPATGDFRPVEGIEQKLKALAGLRERGELFACVLARNQRASSIVEGAQAVNRVAPDEYLKREKLSEFPIIYAADPVDAILRVFELQTKAVRIA